MSETVTLPENTYDAVPYRDHPYPFTHPRCLETLGALFGMMPTDVTRCRVLELGCAGGGNIIPMAVDLPGSQFVGVDLSEVQIKKGQEILRAVGLPNVELRHANIMDLDASWGEFDYIVTHGIFSWVPRPVQDKILDICQSNLSPQGIAYISYNAYPGWHLVRVVRDLMTFHSKQFDDPRKKIEQAKAFLEFLVKLSDENRAMGKLLREEFELLTKSANDAYLFHDHLEVVNEPIYFYEFMERAHARQLQYLADSDFTTMLLRNMPKETHEVFAKLPILQQEQYMDFVRGRRFRKTLLCRAGIPLDRQVKSKDVRRFQISLSGPVTVENVDIRNDDLATFERVAPKHSMRIKDRLAKAATMILREVFPASITFGELYSTALARVAASSPAWIRDNASAAADNLAAQLLMGFSVDMVSFSLHPPHVSYKIAERPAVGPLARFQARHSAMLTTQMHTQVRVDGLSQWVALALDGSKTRHDLEQHFQRAVAAGEVSVNQDNAGKITPNEKQIAAIIEEALTRLCRAGLLQAETSNGHEPERP